MILVILGAGASYDSYPAVPPGTAWIHEDKRPPLAKDLFSNRQMFAEALALFPDCHPIVPYLQSVPKGETIEQTLETLEREAQTDPKRKQQMAAIRYYLHYVIWQCETEWKNVTRGITNYVTLLDQLRLSRQPGEPVCLVTFNYDRMIEDALESVKVIIGTIPEYIVHDEFKLFKLHGSVHWAREVDGPATLTKDRNAWSVSQDLIEKAEHLKISQRYQMVTGYPIGESTGRDLFPAIAVPVETKNEYECPDEHLDCLRSYLPKITKILSIGWRGAEKHFLDLLRTSFPNPVPILAVAEDRHQAEEVIDNFHNAGVRGAGTPAPGGFTDFIVSRKAETFLQS